MAKYREEQDIRLWLTEDEVARILDLMRDCNNRSPVDRRLYDLLASQLDKHLSLRGGTNIHEPGATTKSSVTDTSSQSGMD